MDSEAGLHVAIAPPDAVARPASTTAGWGVRAVVAVGLAACGDGPTVIAPVVDIPFEDPEATASTLDEITLKIAHAGNDRDLVSQTFARGDALELSDAPFGEDLVLHMAGFVGSGNIAYGRTCEFKVPSVDASPPHLFFSRTVKFASLDLAPIARTGGLGIPYLGAGLLVGGRDVGGNTVVTDVEQFDPRTGKLTTFGVAAARDGAVFALLGNSPPRVIVLGGASDGQGAATIEVLDGQNHDRMDFTGTARVDLSATSLTDGRVIVIGGNPPGGPPVGEIDEIAEADDQTIEPRTLTAKLVHPRRGHTATRLGDDVGAPVLIAGGLDATGMPIDVAELFKPLSEELASADTFHPTLNVPRYGHVATLMPDGSALIIGGLDGAGQPVRTLELFSIDAGFVKVGELPDNAGVVELAATPLPDGRILITGGRPTPTSQPTDAAYIIRLDPLNGLVDVVATDHMALSRAGHQAIVLCDGTVLVSGGTPTQQAPERYNPPSAGRR